MFFLVYNYCFCLFLWQRKKLFGFQNFFFLKNKIQYTTWPFLYGRPKHSCLGEIFLPSPTSYPDFGQSGKFIIKRSWKRLRIDFFLGLISAERFFRHIIAFFGKGSSSTSSAYPQVFTTAAPPFIDRKISKPLKHS